MLSPNPFSLLCALLLCLPLALIFTITGHDYRPFSSSITMDDTTAVGDSSRLTLLSLPSSSKHSRPKSPILLSIPTTTASQNAPALPQLPPPVSTSRPKIETPLKTSSSSPRALKQPRRFEETTAQPHHYPHPAAPPPPPPPPETDTTEIQLNFDDNEDKELFKRASRVNSNPRPKRPKKISFMFLTTRTPLPLAPLWERFFKNQRRSYYNIYIHADPTSIVNSNHSISQKPLHSPIFTNRVIPSSKPTRRHTPTLISAARRLLSHALLDDSSNTMFALLSDSCIPLHSFRFTYKTLVTKNRSPRKSYIEILKNETGSYGRWAARGEEAMLPEIDLDSFRIGSQFWVLTRRHAKMVVKDEKKLWDKFKLPCVDLEACYPEENYFPTLLSKVDLKGVVPATLTHVDWFESYDGHPKSYNETEIDKELIQRLRSERPRYGDFGEEEEEIGKGTAAAGDGGKEMRMMTRTNGSDSDNHDDNIARKNMTMMMVRNDPFLFARKFGKNCVQPLLSIANDVIFKD